MNEGNPQDKNKKEDIHFDETRIGRLQKQMYSRKRLPIDRPRQSLTPHQSEVSEDWQTEIPQVIETHKTKSYSLASVAVIGAAVVFLLTLGGVAAYILSGGNSVTTRNVILQVMGPAGINGGETLEMQIVVQNNNDADLELAELIVEYPPGTRTPGTTSTLLENQRIPLGVIPAGETKTGTVRGVIFAPRGAVYDMRVALEYRLRGSNAIFSKEAVHRLEVLADTLDIAVNADTEVTAGQPTAFDIVITNPTQTIVQDVVLSITYPFGFSVTSEDPSSASAGFWELGNLASGDSRTIRVVGTVEAESGSERVFNVSTGTRADTRVRSVDVALATFEHRMTIKKPFLAMDLTFNGQTASEYVAHSGDTIAINLDWVNNLGTPLTDVIVAATVSGNAVDPYAISVSQGFYRSLDSVILWDKTTTGGVLGAVTPGATGELSLRMTPRIIDDIETELNPVITLELHAAGKRLNENNVPETLQATVTRSVKVASDVMFEGRALYFDNPLGSVGPLPPKVEHETTYGIVWEVSNTTNTVRDTVVTAVLPPYIRWLGVVTPSVENITFNENTGEVTWRIGQLAPQTGIGDNVPRRVVFGIGLVPSTSQVGQSPVLVQSQKLTGVDTFTETDVLLTSMPNIDTRLAEEQFSQNYWRVAQ